MSLPAWAPALSAAREDAARSGDDPDAAVRRAFDAWLRETIATVLDAVGGSDGGRNVALNAAAFDLGSLVGAEAMGEDDARDLLVEAGTAAGLDRREALATVKSGLRAGARSPARLPELDGPARRPVRPVARTAPRPEPAPVRLPPDDVAGLWGAARSVLNDDRALRWFNARRALGPAAALRADALDLARCLPLDAKCPPWASCGRWTWATAWPLLLPCFDSAGELVALRARWTATEWSDGRGEWVERRPEEGEGAKEVSPAGSGACRGTVYACPVGRWLLRRGADARPGDLVDGLTPATTWSGDVLVVEGGACWLRYAAEPPGAGGARAVLGLWAGAWPDAQIGRDLATRIPDGARVVLAPDDDDAGGRYADAVTATFRGRAVDLRRLPPPTTGGEDGPRT